MSLKAAAFAVVVAVSLTAAGPDGVLLRRHLKVGAQDIYRFSCHVNQTVQMGAAPGEPSGAPQPEFEIAADMKMQFNVKSVDEKAQTADLDILMTDVKLDLGQMAGIMGWKKDEAPKEMRMNAKLDGRNRILDFSLQGDTAGKMRAFGPAAIMSNLTGTVGLAFVEFPEKAVKAGDTWKVTIPKNPMMTRDAQLDAVFRGEKDFNGRPAYSITIKGKLPVDADLGEMMKENPEHAGMLSGMKMLMTGSIEMSGETLVEKGTGRTLRVETLSRSKQLMEIPDHGMKFTVAGTSTVRLVLQ